MNISDLYKSKLTTAENIASQLQDNWVCAMDIAGCIPKTLADEIARCSAARKFKNVKFHMLLDIYPLEMLKPENEA